MSEMGRGAGEDRRVGSEKLWVLPPRKEDDKEEVWPYCPGPESNERYELRLQKIQV